jgi:hypothetical protein
MRRLAPLIAVLALLAATTATARPAARCSAATLSARLPKQSLPAPVAAMRQRIVNAAVRCDYATLERIGNQGDRLAFSYGKAKSAAAYWRALDVRGGYPLATLVRILRLPVTRNEARYYAWPSAYTQHPTKHDWDLLVRAGVLPRKEADAERKHGNVYYGYRAAIRPNGDWQFFIAGD